MAAIDTKVPDMGGLAVVAANDELLIVDKSDTTETTDGTSKKVTYSTLTTALVTLVGTETLTNKTLTAPTITSPTTTGTDAGAETLTNKTLTSPVINTTISGTAVLDEDDLTTDSNTQVATQQSIKAYVDSGTVTMTNKTLTAPVISTISNTGITTLFTATDTVVGKATTDVLTNKTVVQKVTSYTPAGAGTATLNITTGGIHNITMPAGNITIAISNEAVGQCFMIEITQDGTGSRTVTWFTTIKWAGGSAPTLTTTASKRDTFGFRVTGADTYDGCVMYQNV